MSNKTQLQTNNTALDGYIARINAAKEVAAGLPEAGGGGGGGSVETCTVQVLPGLFATGRFLTYTTIDDSGHIVSQMLENFNYKDVLTCVCDSIVTVCYPASISNFACSSTNGELLINNGYGISVKLTAAEGDTAYIRLIYPDEGM